MRYAIPVVIVFFVLVAVVYFWGFERPVDRLRQEFLTKCLSGQEDTKQYIVALKSKNEAVCEQIEDQNVAVFCSAEVSGTAQACSGIMIPKMADYCEIIVQKDKDACGTDNQCLAYVTGDNSYCDKLAKSARKECRAVVLQDISVVKESDCADASYLLLGKSDRSWCRKISDPLIKEECLS